MDYQKIVCDSCGTELNELNIICPNCGHDKQILHINIEDSVEVYDFFELKGKNDSYNGKRKLRLHHIEGHELSYNGAFVYKLRIIDKDRDYYIERVRDKAGNIIHECEEKLSEHIGHGSAKFKK